jgi:hypothetical protein
MWRHLNCPVAWYTSLSCTVLPLSGKRSAQQKETTKKMKEVHGITVFIGISYIVSRGLFSGCFKHPSASLPIHHT